MIEHESHTHARHTGLPWIDLILAGSAIFISVVSLIVSIHHGRTMEQLVAANEKQVEASTLPILRFTTGNVSDNAPSIHFDLRNGGPQARPSSNGFASSGTANPPMDRPT
ncbi:MAG TPA: hypothetical protein VMI10_05765 [Terriglobales bacterium]|nr:hypothetical protein [Terriglobales bacterium]